MAQPESNSEITEAGPSPPPSKGPGVSMRDLTGSLLGDFEIERLLGRGGMGEVYLARQVSLNRPVAFKVLKPELVTNPAYLARFEAEAWSAAKLNHPNIVHIYTLGSFEDLRFIAMEYVQGSNLRDYLSKRGALDLPLALSILRQTAQAVGAAGELGLIHRDIKPENLLLTKKGQVKVADFGLARDLAGPSHHLTQPGVAMGTPMYMSPEQVQGRPLDHRSDLYSLGVTLYHMLTGQPPYRADSAVALALKHVRDTPVAPRVYRPDLPPELERIVLKLMEKRPEDRYQATGELLRDLAKVREAIQAGPTQQAALSVEVPQAPPGPPAAPPVPAVPRVPLRERLAGVRVGARALALLVPVALLAGMAAGYAGRPADLLGPGAPEPSGPPALWMAPDLGAVPARATPETQFRYAQVEAPEDQLEAAWLAVPARFPADRDWSAKAYVQLARLQFRRRDAGRLRALQADLARSDWEANKALARVARAGASALEGDHQAVIAELNDGEFLEKVVDPGVVELALEVALRANRAGREAEAHAGLLARLTELQRKLYILLLGLESRDPAGRPPSP